MVAKSTRFHFQSENILICHLLDSRTICFWFKTAKTERPCGREEENLKGRSKTLSSVKDKKCLPLPFNEDILGLRRNFLFCVAWLINPDWSKAMTFILMMYFTVWVVVCVIPACCFFFMNVSMKRLLPAYFDKKGKNRLFLFFHQHTSCLLRLHCQLDWQDWLSLYCSYLYQFSESSHQDCLGVLGNSILIVFFSHQRITLGGS